MYSDNKETIMIETLKDLFVNQHGSFFKSLQFETVVIFVLVIFFFTHFFDKSYGFIIILILFALFIANSYADVKKEGLNDFNQITLVKLQKLQNAVNTTVNNKLNLISSSTSKILTPTERQKLYISNRLDSLYIDANLIHFLESLLPLAQYNETEFALLLKATNNILKIKSEIDRYYQINQTYPDNTSELLQIANHLKTKAINNLHDFIYTIPKNQAMRNYLRDAIDRYSVLINRITDSIHESYKNNIKQRGINSSTNFVSYNQTKPFDQLSNHQIIPGIQNQELQEFYV